MKKMYFLVAALCVAAPAFAESLPERTGINSAMGIAPKTDDFIQGAVWSDIFEIQSSQQALSEPSLKDFASKMIEDHHKTSAELKQIVSDNNMNNTLPVDVDESSQKKLDTLHGLHGESFVRQYREDQITAHENALSLFQRYAKNGDNPALKKWAASTVPTLEEHLRLAKNLPQ
ncbi:hypothetical protein BJI49_09600 [Acetobacter pasteurianus]|uniref:DUF4142 domain-containing protein n=3 Tax=Acetobacter pasteurianus TaxID=438 RepID=C7JB67_ACEP3|nr:DUF4142 domain-containing protein [Acetobacter pasteurianus]ASC06737.1 hypothetical protein S101468_02527 [Acetobacter pasteurianus subsp. pasteurianus]OAZ72045.1 hypothetical protein SRCM100623_01972 [Acetobacter pasteurianus]RCL05891.1 hypothetical protein BJI49_09600 [Acetobacter pasteurianus]CCT58581.1 hypothetical protein APA386B_465 [Acetobacter pasteurianus 386B]BAH99670.1 hypothetical protein APA01_15320 [Acetobacter pasteurianus IFO 3283-01]